MRKEVWDFGLRDYVNVDQQQLVRVISKLFLVYVDTFPELSYFFFDYAGHFTKYVQFLNRCFIKVHTQIVEVRNRFLVWCLARVQSSVDLCQRQGFFLFIDNLPFSFRLVFFKLNHLALLGCLVIVVLREYFEQITRSVQG